MNFFSMSNDLQDRINRMNAWKSQQQRADEEFIRKQKIRMFINDCDEIRPNLRNQLLKDSKLCQLEQIKDREKLKKLKKDFDDAWNDVQSRDYQQKTEHENSQLRNRWHEGQSVQNHLKHQMADKLERSLKIHEEINEERKQFAQISQEDVERERERLRFEQKTRKNIKDAIELQMRENRQTRKLQLEQELKCDQMINEQIRKDLEKCQSDEKADREQFRRDVFTYLDHLMMTRHHNATVEREKEKLLEDIRKKAAEDEWNQRCEMKQKQMLVNKVARTSQFSEIKRIEKSMKEEAARCEEENAAFNEREMMERRKIKEAQWQHRLKAFHYGRELMEQKKAEQLRDLAAKQKLTEQILLAAQERERCETMGREFVQSYQDVLPLHPNLVIIQKGKKY